MVILQRIPVQTPIIAQMFRTHLAGYLPKLLVPNSPKLSLRGVRQLTTLGEMLPVSSIFSLSSGHGKCGVAVIRVSGPKAGTALKVIGRFAHLPEPRRAVLRKLWHPRTNQQIDRGLVIWFPGENVLVAVMHVRQGCAPGLGSSTIGQELKYFKYS